MRDDTTPSRLETLGAWLGVWTPPRDVVVPPVPWRRVGVGAALVVLAAVAVAVVVAPAIDENKAERAAREQRELDERRAARRARIAAEQRPRQGFVATGGRRRSLAGLGAMIGRDARRRFDPRAGAAACRPTDGADAARSIVAYDCLVPVRRIEGASDQEGASGTLGIPYRAVVDWGSGSSAFCKTNPIPSEQVLPDPRQVVRLPAACRGPRG